MIIIEGTRAILDAMFFSDMWSTIHSTLFVVVAIILTSSRDFTGVYIIFLVYLIVFATFGSVNPFMVTYNNPINSLVYLVEYLVVGTVYSVIKFWNFVYVIVEQIKVAKQSFINEFHLKIGVQDQIPDTLLKNWTNVRTSKLAAYFGFYGDGISDLSELSPVNQKSLICNWIVCWPLSAVELFIVYPSSKLVIGLCNLLGSVYHGVYIYTIKKSINPSDLM